MIVPVIFILLLPVAFAASVKDDDKADNYFGFSYDAQSSAITAATSSKVYDLVDDVDFAVTVSESDGELPLVGKVKLRLLDKEPVRYNGTIYFRIIDAAGTVSHNAEKDVSFTLRPKHQKSRAFSFPFDVETGTYKVRVTFSR